MDRAVELLLAGSQAAAHNLLEPGSSELCPQLVPLFGRRKGRNEPIHEIQMSGEIIGGIPFDPTDIRRSWNWRPGSWEMAGPEGVRSRRFILHDRYHVQVMQEDPEDFFRHVRNFFAPNSIGPRLVNIGNE